jgi:hypothetical protein
MQLSSPPPLPPPLSTGALAIPYSRAEEEVVDRFSDAGCMKGLGYGRRSTSRTPK